MLSPKSSLSEFSQVTDNAAYCREGPCTLLEKAEQKLVRPNGTVVLPHAEVSSLVNLALPAIVLAKVSYMLWEFISPSHFQVMMPPVLLTMDLNLGHWS